LQSCAAQIGRAPEEDAGVGGLTARARGPRRGVDRNTLFAHQLRELLAPISQALLVDMQPPAELVLGLHDQIGDERRGWDGGQTHFGRMVRTWKRGSDKL
jgi:hypothetical protein